MAHDDDSVDTAKAAWLSKLERPLWGQRADAIPAGKSGADKMPISVDMAVAKIVCPITNAVPIDPVTGEDGRVYERAALEERWAAEVRREAEAEGAASTEAIAKREAALEERWAAEVRRDAEAERAAGAAAVAEREAAVAEVQAELEQALRARDLASAGAAGAAAIAEKDAAVALARAEVEEALKARDVALSQSRESEQKIRELSDALERTRAELTDAKREVAEGIEFAAKRVTELDDALEFAQDQLKQVDSTTTEELERHKSSVDRAFAELVCPITRALPVDPVMAEDGCVYERSAIELQMKRAKRHVQLIPAPQVKNMIRAMVTSGALAGDKVEAWKEKLAEEEVVANAESGDPEAMFTLARWYKLGEKGLARDGVKAFEWYSRSHEAGHAGGTGGLGECYIEGVGVPESKSLGGMFFGIAALGGSQLACYNLGFCLASGSYGFPRDATLARHWYAKVATASIKDLPRDLVEHASAWLRDNPE